MEVKQNDEKSLVKRIVMKSTLAVFVSVVVMNVFVLLTMGAIILVDAVKNSGSLDEISQFMNHVALLDGMEIVQRYGSSGIGYLISIVVAALLFCLIFRKHVSLRDIFVEDEKMTAGIFIACLLIFYAIQLPTEVMSFSMEKLLNLFGLTSQIGQELGSGAVGSVTMGIYVCLGAPIAEELLYRGFIMNSLKKYGVNFAIVISALFFGLMHMNLIQSIAAVFVGLMLGYVAMRYSIKWSMALHIFSNTFSVGMTYLATRFFGDQQMAVALVLEIIIFAAGLFMLVKAWNKIRTFVKANKSEGIKYKWAFSSKLFIFYIVFCLFFAFRVIQVIK